MGVPARATTDSPTVGTRKRKPALLATLLPPWARPRQLAVFDALPRLNTGKVDRRGTPALALPRLRPFPGPRADGPQSVWRE